MKLWIARDIDEELALYIKEPVKLKEQGFFIAHSGDRYYIDNDLFPEVTFENSPKEVEINLINNESMDCS